jgi:hypothetical protein
MPATATYKHGSVIKLCTKCEKLKLHALRAPNGIARSYCTDCQNEVAKAHYHSDRKTYSARRMQQTKINKAAARAFVHEQKNRPCTDCGHSFPYYVMQFDHVRGEKLFNIGANYAGVTREKLIAEIEKCDVVCANCHAIRTHVMSGRG